MRLAFTLVAVSLLGPAVVASDEPSPAALKTAVKKGLDLLEKTSPTFVKKGGCNSCHNQMLPAAAQAFARSRGIATGETLVQLPPEVSEATAGALRRVHDWRRRRCHGARASNSSPPPWRTSRPTPAFARRSIHQGHAAAGRQLARGRQPSAAHLRRLHDHRLHDSRAAHLRSARGSCRYQRAHRSRAGLAAEATRPIARRSGHSRCLVSPGRMRTEADDRQAPSRACRRRRGPMVAGRSLPLSSRTPYATGIALLRCTRRGAADASDVPRGREVFAVDSGARTARGTSRRARCHFSRTSRAAIPTDPISGSPPRPPPTRRLALSAAVDVRRGEPR